MASVAACGCSWAAQRDAAPRLQPGLQRDARGSLAPLRSALTAGQRQRFRHGVGGCVRLLMGCSLGSSGTQLHGCSLGSSGTHEGRWGNEQLRRNEQLLGLNSGSRGASSSELGLQGNEQLRRNEQLLGLKNEQLKGLIHEGVKRGEQENREVGVLVLRTTGFLRLIGCVCQAVLLHSTGSIRMALSWEIASSGFIGRARNSALGSTASSAKSFATSSCDKSARFLWKTALASM